MKKRLSFCLILVLLLSFAIVPAYASSSIARNKTQMIAETYLPQVMIEVVVPTSGNVYINPNRLPVQIGADVVNSQIVSDAFCIQNLTEVPVSVNVDVTGKVKSGSKLSLSSSSTAGSTSKLKKAFIYFEIQAVSDPDSVSWANAYDPDQHIVVRESKRSRQDVIILDAVDGSKCYGAFRLAGDCTENPKDSWSSKDGVNVNVAFTFSLKPVGTEIP